MGDFVLPREIIEKILSYLDGKTLSVCQEVSPEFADAVVYLTSRNIWRKCCYNEITKGIIFQIVTKLYPHGEGFNHPKNWRLIYNTWCLLNNIQCISEWDISSMKLSDEYTKVCDVDTHGNLILVLMKYNKNYSEYYKIKTINDQGDCLDKSCRLRSESIYVTPAEDPKISHDDVLLYCEICKLAAIPVTPIPGDRTYPKIRFSPALTTVEHCNGDIMCFYYRPGLLGRTKCVTAVTEFCPNEQTQFIKVTLEDSHLHVTFEDVYRIFYPAQYFHASVTSAHSCVGLIFLGTDTGTLYGYFCKDKQHLSDLHLSNFNWKFDISWNPILAIDVMIEEDKIGIVCSTEERVYLLTAAN